MAEWGVSALGWIITLNLGTIALGLGATALSIASIVRSNRTIVRCEAMSAQLESMRARTRLELEALQRERQQSAEPGEAAG